MKYFNYNYFQTHTSSWIVSSSDLIISLPGPRPLNGYSKREPHVSSSRPCGMCSWRRQIGTRGRGSRALCRDEAQRLAASDDSGDRSTRASPPWGPKRRPNIVLAWNRTKGISYPQQIQELFVSADGDSIIALSYRRNHGNLFEDIWTTLLSI